MAPAPRELAENILGAWSRSERLDPDVLAADVQWVNPGDAVETGTRRERSGFGTAQEKFSEGFRVERFEIEAVETAGDAVGMRVAMHTVARGSGMSVRNELGFRFDFRDGRLARFEWSNDPEAFLPLS
jgi:ketosteroid isomerase-like protein